MIAILQSILKDIYISKPLLLLVLLKLLNPVPIQAQVPENPPIPIQVEVNTAQFLDFGVFAHGTSGGTVSVDYNGNRTSTGEIALLNIGPSVTPALFDVTANPGTIIQIQTNPNIRLDGSNGGSIYLNFDSYSLGQTFITTANPPATNAIYIGGTLSIGNASANPPGQYSGTATITFIHQ
jgi:hypothetical protein